MIPKHKVGPRYVALPSSRTAILFCNKAGTQSLRQLEGASMHLPLSMEQFREEMQEFDLIAQFVRDPLKRIISAYRYAVGVSETYRTKNILCPLSPSMWDWLRNNPRPEFEHFVHCAIRDFPEDKHVAPQYGAHDGMANFLWPFEDIAGGWQQLQERVPDLPELPWINASDRTIHVEITPRAKEAILDFYSDDYKWWKDVCGKAELCAA